MKLHLSMLSPLQDILIKQLAPPRFYSPSTYDGRGISSSRNLWLRMLNRNVCHFLTSRRKRQVGGHRHTETDIEIGIPRGRGLHLTVDENISHVRQEGW